MARSSLIVEDDASALQCYGRLFRRRGYQAALEHNGRSVERNLDRYRDVGVVILDYRLPGMDGLELLARLRERGFSAAAVLVSAHADAEMIERARRLGIQRIFSKPLDIGRLLAAVDEAFESVAS